MEGNKPGAVIPPGAPTSEQVDLDTAIDQMGNELQAVMDVDDSAQASGIVKTGNFEEDPDMELGEEDMEEVVFDEADDKPPSDDEDDGDDGFAAADGLDDGASDDGKRKPLGEAVPDAATCIFTGHSDSVYCVDLSPDGSMAVSGGGDDCGYLWNPSSGTILFKLEGHTDSVSSCGFNFDGKLAATAAYDSVVKVWNADDGQLLRTLEGPSSEIEFIRWHSKGNVILAGSEDATAWIWDAASGNCLAVLAGHEAALSCGGFTTNGKRALTGSLDGTVRIWDPKTSSCLHSFGGHDFHQAGVVSLASSISNPVIVAGGQDGTARLASLEHKRILGKFEHGDAEQATGDVAPSVEAVAFCPTNPFLATGGTDGKIKIFDLNNQSVRFECKHQDTVMKVEFLPDSPLFVSGSVDGTGRLWDARSGECVKVLTGHKDLITDFAMVRGQFVSCSDDHTCRVSPVM